MSCSCAGKFGMFANASVNFFAFAYEKGYCGIQ